MFVLSQNGEKLVYVTNVKILEDYNEQIQKNVYVIINVDVNADVEELARYETKERAKEIIRDMFISVSVDKYEMPRL